VSSPPSPLPSRQYHQPCLHVQGRQLETQGLAGGRVVMLRWPGIRPCTACSWLLPWVAGKTQHWPDYEHSILACVTGSRVWRSLSGPLPWASPPIIQGHCFNFDSFSYIGPEQYPQDLLCVWQTFFAFSTTLFEPSRSEHRF